jgi:hypothetical protein
MELQRRNGRGLDGPDHTVMRRSAILIAIGLVGLLVATVAIAVPDLTGNQPGPPGAHSASSSGEAAVADVRVLSEPVDAADALPNGIAAVAEQMERGAASVDDALQPGSLDLSASHRLLVAKDGRSFYAVPTSKGRVCYFLAAVGGDSADGAGCATSFDDLTGRVAWFAGDPDELGAGKPVTVGGLVPDDVTGVGVLVDGVIHESQFQNNAFVYELPSSSSWPTALEVSYRDGTSGEVSLAAAPSS